MEELFKALHDGGEGSLFSGECTDGLVYVKGGKELFELDRIGIPMQRGFDVRFGCDEEIRVVRTFLIVLGVEYNFVVKSKFIFPNFRKKKFPHFSEV